MTTRSLDAFRLGRRPLAITIAVLALTICPPSEGGATATGQRGEPLTEHAAVPATLHLATTRSMARNAAPEYFIGADGRGANPRHGLALTFAPRGALIERAGSDGPPRRANRGFALRLQSFGREEGKPVRHARPHIDGAWVAYDRGAGLSEWFVNLPRGVEQGWTLAEPPAGNGPLALTLDTERPADRADDGQLTWSGLVYHGLAAIDANGRELPSRWVHEGTRLRIEVDDATATYPILIDPWIQEARLTASDRVAGDQFGRAVALDGDTALVGARFVDVEGHANQGAAYVFTRSDGEWSEQGRLVASDGAAGAAFGSAVALSGDTALVGADGGPAGIDEGAAYVFTRDDGVWSEQAKLEASDGVIGDFFGATVALAGDTALVGAPSGPPGVPSIEETAAYVFTRNDGAWSEQARLTASDAGPFAQFGSSVALSGDTALIGAVLGPEPSSPTGTAYVFVRDGDGWNEQAELTPTDGVALDVFGWSAALDGDTAVVGAPQVSISGTTGPGAAYVFTRSNDVWEEQAKLIASDGALGDAFGAATTLAGDTAVVGAPALAAAEASPGAAYVFTRDDGVWNEQTTLTASDGVADDRFGVAAALSGNATLVGANGADAERGAAYVFTHTGADAAAVQGTVRSLGHCGAATAPLQGATVEISGAENSFILETDAVGSYQIGLPASESPIDITVTEPGHLPATVEGIAFDSGDTVVQDFELMLDAPCVTVEPATFSLALEEDQTATETLTLGNVDGVAALDWTVGTAELPGAGFAGRTGPPGLAGDGHEPNADGGGAGSGAGRNAAIDPPLVAGRTFPGVRPVNRIGGVVDCDDEVGLIAHDDGTIENSYGGLQSIPNVILVDRFTPSAYPASFEAVCIAFYTDAQDPADFEFDLVVFDDDGPDGQPGSELGSLTMTAVDVPPVGSGVVVWQSADIASLGITIDSGSVYIGGRWAVTDPNLYVVADESPSRPSGFAGGHAWTPGNGWFPIEVAFPDYRSLFVRAVENPGGCLDPSTVAWLSVASTSGSTPAGESSALEITVDTTGLAPGEYTASLCIESNDPVHPLVAVPVTLTVTPPLAPDLALDPSNLDFGDVEVGSPSAPQTSTLQNTGNAEATELGFGVPGGGFDADTGACGDTLPAGESCTVGVTFAPAEPGPATATLQVTSAEGASADLGLTGNGVAAGVRTPTGLEIDPEELVSDGNGVFEPGELVIAAPLWRNDGGLPKTLTGTTSELLGPDGVPHTVEEGGADYGTLEPGESGSCLDTEDCYSLAVGDPAARPMTHWDATFEETLDDAAETGKAWTVHIGGSFSDVPPGDPFYPAIETLLHSGVTEGCTASEYCPGGVNSRSQMPVFVLRALEGVDYTPPDCTEGATEFPDVPAANPFCPWIEELAGRGIVSGCGNGNYCPGDEVTRAQMAIFLLKTLEGADYAPPPCSETFDDVSCPSLFADWIEELAAREITGGCSETGYCPGDPVSRAQMAVFVARTFGLTLYGP